MSKYFYNYIKIGQINYIIIIIWYFVITSNVDLIKYKDLNIILCFYLLNRLTLFLKKAFFNLKSRLYYHLNINYLPINNNFNLLIIATAKRNTRIQHIKSFIYKTDPKFKNKT